MAMMRLDRKTIKRKFNEYTQLARGLIKDWPEVRDLLQKSTYEVKPVEGGWIVLDDKSGVTLHRYTKKSQAVKSATDLAKSEKAQIAIYSRDGSVETRQAYYASH